jgi:hypothetical protein
VLWSTCFSQNSISIGIKSGFLFYDLINQKEDTDNVINGYGTQLDVFINYKNSIGRLHIVNGIGFTRFDHLDNNFYFTLERNPNRSRLLSNYLNASVGTRFPIKNSKIYFGADLIAYFLAHKHRINFTERRVFANLDMSFNFCFKRFEFLISTPLTLLPMYRENTIESSYLSQTGEFVQINSFVEMTGLHVGCRFKIWR